MQVSGCFDTKLDMGETWVVTYQHISLVAIIGFRTWLLPHYHISCFFLHSSHLQMDRIYQLACSSRLRRRVPRQSFLERKSRHCSLCSRPADKIEEGLEDLRSKMGQHERRSSKFMALHTIRNIISAIVLGGISFRSEYRVASITWSSRSSHLNKQVEELACI